MEAGVVGERVPARRVAGAIAVRDEEVGFGEYKQVEYCLARSLELERFIVRTTTRVYRVSRGREGNHVGAKVLPERAVDDGV